MLVPVVRADEEEKILADIRVREGLLGQLKHSFEWRKTFPGDSRREKFEYDKCRAEVAELKLRYLTGEKTVIATDPAKVSAQADEIEGRVSKIIREERERRKKEFAEMLQRQALDQKLDGISRQLEELKFIRGGR